MLHLVVIIRLNTVPCGDPGHDQGQRRLSSRSRLGSTSVGRRIEAHAKGGRLSRPPSAGEVHGVRAQVARALHQRALAGSHWADARYLLTCCLCFMAAGRSDPVDEWVHGMAPARGETARVESRFAPPLLFPITSRCHPGAGFGTSCTGILGGGQGAQGRRRPVTLRRRQDKTDQDQRKTRFCLFLRSRRSYTFTVAQTHTLFAKGYFRRPETTT